MGIKNIIVIVFAFIIVIAFAALKIVQKKHQQDPDWVTRQQELEEEEARRALEEAELDEAYPTDNFDE